MILIDEPERHLHRSIIAPLLTELFKRRRDCAFIISTHDVSLPLDNPAGRTLLVRGCSYSGENASSWGADVVPSDAEIDDALKRDILGSRKKLLFVEGTRQHSLDLPLYSLVFPEVSVIAKDGCREVEHAVKGIRDSAGLLWLHAWGIVDNDGRPNEETARLKSFGVHALGVFSVEAIYYHPEIQKRVAERLGSVTGANVNTTVEAATDAAISAMGQHVQRLSERVAEKAVRGEFFQNVPGKEQIRARNPVNITIDVASKVAAEIARLESALAAKRLVELIARYPIRETQALDKIAENIGFQDREQYEQAVRRLLMDDADALAFVRSLFGTLYADITAAN